MNELKLLVMKIRNFKGFKEAEFKMNGNSVEILGPNGSGKTSTFDLFTWVMFGKDSKGDTKFQIKPVDQNNNEIHNLDTEGELILDFKGQVISLKKVLQEKWSKQHGTGEKSFTNTIKYYIDDVPVKKKDYDQFVSEILNEEQFRLITSTTFFNEQMKWQDRRKILFELAGDITDEEVLNSSVELQPLIEKLNGLSIEKRKIQVDEKRKLLKNRISELGPRIDEASRNLPDQETDTSQDLETVELLRSKLNDYLSEKQKIQSGSNLHQKKNDLREMELELKSFENGFNSKNEILLLDVSNEYNELKSIVSQLEFDLKSKQMQINYKYDQARNLNEEKQSYIDLRISLLREYEKLEKTNYEKPVFDHSCPTCNQDLPEKQIEEVEKNHLEKFNLDKSKGISEIEKKGFPLKDKILKIEDKLLKLKFEIDELNKEFNDIKSKLDFNKIELEKIYEKYEKLKSSAPKLEEDLEYISLKDKFKETQKELEDLNLNALSLLTDIKLKINSTESEINLIEQKLGNVVNISAVKQRIKELEDEQFELNDQYEGLEYILFLINKFERTKASMVTDKVNSMFKFVTFKLFHEQMEGGIKETCETLYKGVSYQNGLNTAAKTNAGLDIVNVLQKYNGVLAPVFLDNRESVVNLIETDTQVISLVVDGSLDEIKMK